MTRKEELMLASLISFFCPEEREHFAKFIRPSLSFPQVKSPSFDTICSPISWAKNIHYSWFEDFFDGLPKKFFTDFLSDKEQKRLKKEGKKRGAAPFALSFLALLLKKRLMSENILPKEQLSPSTLHLLLELPKEKIVRLIDLLGLYDLSLELRHIVEKKRLTQIFAFFTDEERALINYFAKQPVKWVPPRLMLEKWDGQKASLLLELHNRGLIRLAKALSDEDESFVWHLVHKLDVGRGKIILKWIKSEGEKAMIASFKAEVINLMKRFSP